VVGPGSRHETGGLYAWDGAPPADLYAKAAAAPDWAIRALCCHLDNPESGHRPRRRGGPGGGPPEPGGDDEYLWVLRTRYPIAGPGQRNDQMTGAVGWLAGRRLPRDRILTLTTDWLRSYQDVYQTPIEQAVAELHALVARTCRKIEAGEYELPPEHQRLTACEQLIPELQDFWKDCTTLLAHSCSSPRVHARTRACEGGREEGTPERQQESTNRFVLSCCCSSWGCQQARFLEALLLHYQYELQTKGEGGQLLMTDRQLMEIYERRFGQRLSWKALAALKARYFTRRDAGGRWVKADLLELVILDRPGVIARPSAYRVGCLPRIGGRRLEDPAGDYAHLVESSLPWWLGNLLPEYDPEAIPFDNGGADEPTAGPDHPWWLDEDGEG
jgi:hypothetical protein